MREFEKERRRTGMQIVDASFLLLKMGLRDTALYFWVSAMAQSNTVPRIFASVIVLVVRTNLKYA
jgi:hypothetical protein